MPVYFGGHRAPQQVDGHDQARFPSCFHQNAFDAGEWSLFNQHSLPDLHVWIRSDEQARLNHSAHPFDLAVRNMLGHFAESDHIYNTGRCKDGQTVVWIKPAEKIARKQKPVSLFYTVRPALLDPIRWRELFVATLTQMCDRNSLVMGAET